MKEVHAYQNDDGTYRVTVMNKSEKKLPGDGRTDKTIEGTMDCRRAIIEITPLLSDEEQVKVGRIML